MNKRVIAAVGAGVLALLGVLVLVLYAQGANDRAFDGAKLVSVVRLTKNVQPGTSATDLAGSVEIARIPDEAVPDGAVTDLKQVTGLKTNASIQAGEVLLKSRMVSPEDKVAGNGSVPKGFQEITILLDNEHSVGGAVKAGDRVGVIATFEPKDGSAQIANFTLNQMLVTRVAPTLAGGDAKAVTGNLITIAVKPLDAEKIAYTQKWGVVWLTLQNADTDTSGNKLINGLDVLK